MDVDRSRVDATAALEALHDLLPLDARVLQRVASDTGRARVRAAQDRIHLTLETLEDGRETGPLERREIDIITGPNVLVSVHDGQAASIERFRSGADGETGFGALTAADLLSTLVDEVINGYFVIVERIEREIDELDQRALRGRPGDDLLDALVAARRQVSLLRRTLAPHRSALSALARPELQAEDLVGQPWPGLVDRVEVAMGAVDGLRDALLGTYDIHMGRVAQRANDVMKVLTLLSAVLLPAVVLAGVMGMNFKLAFFDESANFFVVVAAMVVLAGLILGIGRWRHWL